jgi:hypothetical protein
MEITSENLVQFAKSTVADANSATYEMTKLLIREIQALSKINEGLKKEIEALKLSLLSAK